MLPIMSSIGAVHGCGGGDDAQLREAKDVFPGLVSNWKEACELPSGVLSSIRILLDSLRPVLPSILSWLI